jgi:hypothetical protein
MFTVLNTLFEAVGLRVPNRNFRDFSLFDFAFNVETVLLDELRRQMPSSDTDVFNEIF